MSTANDFIFVDTAGTATPAGQRLGAPGPQNLASPRLNSIDSRVAARFDHRCAGAAKPRSRYSAAVTNGPTTAHCR